jgi:hypothetical protein
MHSQHIRNEHIHKSDILATVLTMFYKAIKSGLSQVIACMLSKRTLQDS